MLAGKEFLARFCTNQLVARLIALKGTSTVLASILAWFLALMANF